MIFSKTCKFLNVNLDVVEPLPLACLPAVSDSWFGERASEASGISYIKNKKNNFIIWRIRVVNAIKSCKQQQLEETYAHWACTFFMKVQLISKDFLRPNLRNTGLWRAWCFALAPMCCEKHHSQPISPVIWIKSKHWYCCISYQSFVNLLPLFYLLIRVVVPLFWQTKVWNNNIQHISWVSLHIE